MTVYASLDDIGRLWRELTSAEQERAAALLPVISAMFRLKAKSRGYDLDTLIEEDEDFELLVRSAVVDVISYNMALSSNDSAGAVSQVSESALGYSQTVSYSTPKTDDLYVPESVWKKLGFKKQRFGVMEVF